MTHSPSSCDHYSHLNFVLFCEILKSGDGLTEGQTTRAKIVTVGQPCGSIFNVFFSKDDERNQIAISISFEALEMDSHYYLEKLKSFSEFDPSIYETSLDWEKHTDGLGNFLTEYTNRVNFYYNGPPETFWLDLILPRIDDHIGKLISNQGLLKALQSLDLFAYDKPWFYPTISSYKQDKYYIFLTDKCELELNTLEDQVEASKVCDGNNITASCQEYCAEIKTYEPFLEQVASLFQMSVEKAKEGYLQSAPLCIGKEASRNCWTTVINNRGICHSSQLGLY